MSTNQGTKDTQVEDNQRPKIVLNQKSRAKKEMDPITGEWISSVKSRPITFEELNPAKVREMARTGMSKREIARLLRVEPADVEIYDAAFQYGLTELKQQLRSKQLNVAFDGNVTMLIWLGKNLLNQTERPIDTDSTIDNIKFELIEPTENQ